MKGAGQNADGTQRVKGSYTFQFVYKKDVPKGKNIMYAQFYCDIQCTPTKG